MDESAEAVQLKQLENRIQSLEATVALYKEKFSKIYNEDQLKLLSGEKIPEWSSESIMKGLKYRFGLSVKGYEFLTDQSHPLPGYSTLAKRLQSYKVTNWVFTDLYKPLKKQV